MPTKIRLQRKGKKASPFYQIVIADGRAPRDGKYIERIGTYNPITQPADIKLDFDRALYWVQTGAQPTDTVRNILSYTGVMYKHHLLKGVTKGALTEEQAEAKFDSWMNEKLEKISGIAKDQESTEREAQKSRMDAEKKINEDRAQALADKRMAELKAQQPEEVVEEEAVAETPAAEETPAKEETPAAEATPEKAPVEEAKKEEAPAKEVKKEEAPAEVKAEEPKAEEKAEEPKAEEKPVEKAKEEPKAEKSKEEPKAETKEEEKPAEGSEEKKAE